MAEYIALQSLSEMPLAFLKTERGKCLLKVHSIYIYLKYLFPPTIIGTPKAVILKDKINTIATVIIQKNKISKINHP